MIERGGRVTTEDVVAQLAVVVGAEALVRAFHTKKKRYDERVAQKLLSDCIFRTGIEIVGVNEHVRVDKDTLAHVRPS